MKNFYIVVAIEQNKNENIFTETTPEYKAGYYSYVIKCTESTNIKNTLESVQGLLHANIYPTKKQATEVVTRWNATYKANNTYLFNEF